MAARTLSDVDERFLNEEEPTPGDENNLFVGDLAKAVTKEILRVRRPLFFSKRRFLLFLFCFFLPALARVLVVVLFVSPDPNPYDAARACVDGMQETFGQYGTVVEAIVKCDKMSGRNLGFGFVRMATHEQAANAKARAPPFLCSIRSYSPWFSPLACLSSRKI